MAEARRRDHRAEPQRRRPRGERVDRPPGVERAALAVARSPTGSGRSGTAPRSPSARRRRPARPSPPRSRPPGLRSSARSARRESYPLAPCRARSSGPSTPRCVLVWSSTWVVIAVGLEDIAPFFGAGHPLLAGGRRRARRGRARCGARCAPTAALAALIGAAAVRHHLRADLLGRAVRPVRPDRRAVRRAAALRRAAGGRVRCRRSRCSPRLLAGVGDRARRARARVRREPAPRQRRARRRWPRWRSSLSPLASAIGNVAIKRRGADARPAGDERLGDARRRRSCCSRSRRRPRTGARRCGRRRRSARSSISPCSAPASRS